MTFLLNQSFTSTKSAGTAVILQNVSPFSLRLSLTFHSSHHIFFSKLQRRHKNVTSGRNETRNCPVLEFLTLHYNRHYSSVFSDVTSAFVCDIFMLSYSPRFRQSVSYLRTIPQPASNTKHLVPIFILVSTFFLISY